MSAAKPSNGSFAPLRQPVFAVLWAATVLGNTGSFMRDVASSWLMTDLSAAPAAVALVQAAATLPIFLLAIPAGVLSDILDRRKFLIAIQLLLASVSITLMVLSYLDMLSVSALIGLTFLGGVGAALMGPTWQAIVPELVPREDVKGAVALNSLGINIARSIGPAAGGLLLAAFGAAATYGVDVASYILVIAALVWWPRARNADDALSEGFFGAFRAGLRYTRSSKPLHVVLLRAAIFFAFASAVWALLPLVARQLLGGDASFYGLLLGSVGAGAIGGALVMPRLRQHLDSDSLLLGSAVTHGTGHGGALARPAAMGGNRRSPVSRCCMDHRAHHPQWRSTGGTAKLGARPRACRLSDRLQWCDDSRQSWMGCHRGSGGCLRYAPDRGRRLAGRRCHHAPDQTSIR